MNDVCPFTQVQVINNKIHASSETRIAAFVLNYISEETIQLYKQLYKHSVSNKNTSYLQSNLCTFHSKFINYHNIHDYFQCTKI